MEASVMHATKVKMKINGETERERECVAIAERKIRLYRFHTKVKTKEIDEEKPEGLSCSSAKPNQTSPKHSIVI